MALVADGFEWDDGNRDKCRKHGLSHDDIEYVLLHSETLIVPDLKNSMVEPRSIAIGRTMSGRYAFVVFTLRTKGSVVLLRPISARHMHGKEIATYEEEISRIENR